MIISPACMSSHLTSILLLDVPLIIERGKIILLYWKRKGIRIEKYLQCEKLLGLAGGNTKNHGNKKSGECITPIISNNYTDSSSLMIVNSMSACGTIAWWTTYTTCAICEIRQNISFTACGVFYASRRSRTRDTVKLTVCLCVCVCVYSSCNCSTVAMRRKLTGF